MQSIKKSSKAQTILFSDRNSVVQCVKYQHCHVFIREKGLLWYFLYERVERLIRSFLFNTIIRVPLENPDTCWLAVLELKSNKKWRLECYSQFNWLYHYIKFTSECLDLLLFPDATFSWPNKGCFYLHFRNKECAFNFTLKLCEKQFGDEKIMAY